MGWDAVTAERWRVAALIPHAPAHRVLNPDLSLMTACGWLPTGGVLISRAQAQLLQCHPCRKCLGGKP